MEHLITPYLFWFKSLFPWQWLMFVPVYVLLLSAASAVVLRNLFHSALCLILSSVALGILFVGLGAEFVGLVQILVYVGAVAMLIIFAIFLTRREEMESGPNPFAGLGALAGIVIAFLVLGGLLSCIFLSPSAKGAPKHPPTPTAPVAAIGQALTGDYLLPLEATGVLLTTALVGAALLAKEERL